MSARSPTITLFSFPAAVSQSSLVSLFLQVQVVASALSLSCSCSYSIRARGAVKEQVRGGGGAEEMSFQVTFVPASATHPTLTRLFVSSS